MITDEAHITIVLTGALGAGKSAAGNFFLQQNIFESGMQFRSVTKETVVGVGMIGGKSTKFVDTPGLLEPGVKSEDETEKLAKAILAVPNGIHAVGVVINIRDYITTKHVSVLESLLAFIEMVPYVFVIFSNACVLGETHEEQQHQFKIKLNGDGTPEILYKLLKEINYRYIILESVENMENSYYDTKADELMKIVDSILDKKKRPFTCFLTDTARSLKLSNESKEKCIAALKKDLNTANKRCSEETDDKNNAKDETNRVKKNAFWKQVFIFMGGGAGAIGGAILGAAAGPVGSAAGGAAGVTLGTSAVAAMIGGGVIGSAGGGAAGLGIAAGVNKCRTQ